MSSSRIAVDGYFCDDERTGMGVVLFNLLESLSGQDLTFGIDVLIPDRHGYTDLKGLCNERVEIVCLPSRPFPVWEQVVLRRWAREGAPSLMWHPYNTAPLFSSCATVITVHDLIYLDGRLTEPPTLYKRFGKAYRRFVVPKVIGRAKRVMTVSNYSATEIERRLDVPKGSIDVIHPGLYASSDRPARIWSGSVTERASRRPFILAAGSLEPRKNVLLLLEAYQECLCSEPAFPSLVFYGFRGFEGSEAQRRARELGLSERVEALPFISEERKFQLFSDAEFFVFPSLNEGFGIPVIEAFSVGCPVIASRRGALPEVAGDSALYVDPDSTESMSQEMLRLHRDAGFRDRLARKGRIRSAQFSWEAAGRSVRLSLEHAFRVE